MNYLAYVPFWCIYIRSCLSGAVEAFLHQVQDLSLTAYLSAQNALAVKSKGPSWHHFKRA
jgi:hypothetical protein